MTRTTLKAHLNYHARQMAAQASNGVLVQFPMDKLDEFLDTVIESALGDFWGARRWPFRRISYTLPITVAANPYALPDDFAAMSSIVDTTNDTGYHLFYLDKEEFDKRYPNPAFYTVGSERVYSLGLIQGENAWKIWFAPIPAINNTIPMTYFSESPKDPAAVPDRYVSGLLAACARYLFRLGSKERNEAWMMAEAEYNRLESIPAFNAALPDTTGGIDYGGQIWSPFKR